MIGFWNHKKQDFNNYSKLWKISFLAKGFDTKTRNKTGKNYLKDHFVCWEGVVDRSDDRLCSCCLQRGIYSNSKLWHPGSSSRFVLCVRFTMDVRAIGNELQFVNGGKFERVLDFWPTIMKGDKKICNKSSKANDQWSTLFLNRRYWKSRGEVFGKRWDDAG